MFHFKGDVPFTRFTPCVKAYKNVNKKAAYHYAALLITVKSMSYEIISMTLTLYLINYITLIF